MGSIRQILLSNILNGNYLMSKPKLAIMAVSHNIDSDIIRRFIWSLRASETKIPFDIFLGSHKNPKETFRKTTILNDIIRQIINTHPVMVQTDIDMMTPPGLLQSTINFTLTGLHCYHCNYRYVESEEVERWMKVPYRFLPWNEIRKRKTFRASGSWNGMSSLSWLKSNGFCEEIYNLGGPDTEFYKRTSKLGIRWLQDNNFPLSHINHKRRSVPKQGEKNLQLAKSFSIDYNWLKHRKDGVCNSTIERIGVNY